MKTMSNVKGKDGLRAVTGELRRALAGGGLLQVTIATQGEVAAAEGSRRARFDQQAMDNDARASHLLQIIATLRDEVGAQHKVIEIQTDLYNTAITAFNTLRELVRAQGALVGRVAARVQAERARVSAPLNSTATSASGGGVA